MRSNLIRFPSGPEAWSEDLKAQTWDMIEDRGAVATHGGRHGLKHVASIFSIFSTDELIAAGWVID